MKWRNSFLTIYGGVVIMKIVHILIVLMCLSGICFGLNKYTGTGNWNDELNWSEGIPFVNGGSTSQAGIGDGAECTVSESEPNEAVCGYLHVGWGGEATLNITDNGKLTGGNAFIVGTSPSYNASGYVNITGGEVTFPNMYAGKGGGAIINIGSPGGTLNITNNLNFTWDATNHLPGEITITDGGTFNLGGTVAIGDGTGGQMIDIAGGTMVFSGDQIELVEDLIQSGILIASGGRANVLYDYDTTAAGMTTVTSSPADYNIAWNIDPIGSVDKLQFWITWNPGDNVQETDEHYVYFSDDPQLVENGDPSVLTVRDTPNLWTPRLEYGKTYYLRIDQVNTAHPDSPWAGPVYQIQTIGYLPIDNMEAYNTGGNLITSAWSDEGGGTLALDTDIVLADQSMKLDYDNTSTGYSEAVLTLDALINGTADSLDSLGISFWGDSLNDVDDMYLAVWDPNSGNTAVVYFDGDISELTDEVWHEWNIDYADLTAQGIYLHELSNIAVGFGQRGSSTPTGKTGTVYIDNIYLYPERSAIIPADVTANGIINMGDVALLGTQWLNSFEHVTAVPVASSPILYYPFDETSGFYAIDQANIDSLNCDSYITDFSSSHWKPEEGKVNGCLKFEDNFGLRMQCDGDLFNTHVSTGLTISVWLMGDAASQPFNKGFIFAGGLGSDVRLGFRCPDLAQGGGETANMWKVNSNNYLRSPITASDYESQWVHYAVTYSYDGVNPGSMKTYKNGILIGEMEIEEELSDLDEFAIGIRHNADNSEYAGKLDEFRVYNVELSQAEILTLAGLSEVDQPFLDPVDVDGDQTVNEVDLLEIMKSWLLEPVFP